MFKFLNTFRKDEDGAVTVDWVVLTAAVVGLAIAAYSGIQGSALGLIGSAADTVADENDFGAADGGGDAGGDAGAGADAGAGG